MLPLRRKNLHYEWHWFWSTGTGECGSRGAHASDHTWWLVGEDRLPTNIQTIAGRLGWDDDGETPNIQITLFDGLEVPMIYELRILPEARNTRTLEKFCGHGTTMFLECENGYVVGGRGFIQAFRPDRKLIRRFDCDAGRGHQANISYRVGQLAGPDAIGAALHDHAPLAESWQRLREHPARNEIDLHKTRLTLGPKLAFDARAERFTGDAGEWGILYLSRLYRPPYLMPDKI